MPAATIARMNRLDTEHQRLFASDPDATAEGRLRHLVLALSGPADWAPLSAVWRGVQADLDLPAPAIAVNGVDAFELWFSLADPVPIHTAAAFLDGLCDRYLGDVAPARRRCWPSSDPGLQVEPARVPQLQAETGRWSAFVAPDLAAVFGDDPSLDIPPGDEAQADLLSRACPIADRLRVEPDVEMSVEATLRPVAGGLQDGVGRRRAAEHFVDFAHRHSRVGADRQQGGQQQDR